MDNDNINNDRAQIINENHMENCNVFLGNIYGASFPLPGAHVTIEQHYGDGQKPTSNVPKGQVKSEENQEEKKIREAAFAGYQINKELMAVTNEECMVLHCLPAHRGEEITAEVFEAHANEIFDEAENRLHAQKAVMVALMEK